MRSIAFQIWKTLKIDSLSLKNSLRVKELFLLLHAAEFELNFNLELSITTAVEISHWIEELSQIVGQQKYINWAYKSLVDYYQLVPQRKITDEKILILEIPAQVLSLVEQYRTAADPLQETNFGGQIYIQSCLTAKINLLYQIGKLVEILTPNETFNRCTRVDREVQDVCNRVCSWVEGTLDLVMKPVNIYEPFIEDYKKFSFKRPSALKEIGVRAGILSEKVFEKYELSGVNAEIVTRWVEQNYGIKLSYADEDFIGSTDRQQTWLKATLIAIPVVLCLPLGIIAYDYLHRQLFPNPQEVLLEKMLSNQKSSTFKPVR